MKAAMAKLVSKKTFLTRTIIVAGLILVCLPSCKHGASCDAYQGSGKGTRSFKKKHHAEVLTVRAHDFKA